MDNRWFWESKLASWIEGNLLTLTNWFWNKRHQLPPKKEHQLDTTNENKKKSVAKKTPAKKAPAKKKTNWNVK